MIKKQKNKIQRDLINGIQILIIMEKRKERKNKILKIPIKRFLFL